MYKMIVGEIGSMRREKWNIRNDNPYSVWDGEPFAAENCRISALSSADYCLRDRVDVDWGSVAWKGTAEEIRRVFRAERLDSAGLKDLKEGKDYAVLFLELCFAECA
ncbi:MAG: hypothetical protein IJE81_06220 [Oscillospiraceae bacterium]|nr:hypothetical protein [Oscillospiraceae bacterium]